MGRKSPQKTEVENPYKTSAKTSQRMKAKYPQEIIALGLLI
jgi:hypothetical protein